MEVLDALSEGAYLSGKCSFFQVACSARNTRMKTMVSSGSRLGKAPSKRRGCVSVSVHDESIILSPERARPGPQ